MNMLASSFVDQIKAPEELTDCRKSQPMHPTDHRANGAERPARLINLKELGITMHHLGDLVSCLFVGKARRGKKRASALVPPEPATHRVLRSGSVQSSG